MNKSDAAVSHVGRPTLRVEDRPLLTGAAEFLDDLELNDPLHVVFARSQVAHGEIRSIDVSAAATVPGVVAIFTAEDLAGVPDLVPPLEDTVFSPPRPLLARDRVRFVGEPIAIIVANSPYQGEDAAALIDADIDPLPVVRDLTTAMDKHSPLLHDTPGGLGNVLLDSSNVVGDPDAAFAAASYVVERVFRHGRVTASPMEARGAAAYPDDDGVTLWCSTQFPHVLRDIVKELFGWPSVRVRCPDIGGGFGLKSTNYPEEILTAWTAMRLGRAVKWVEDRSEHLMASNHARDFEVRARMALDADGRICAVDVDAICDTGAYGVYPLGHILEVMGVVAMTPGPYRLRNYRSRARSVCTNKCPAGPYRGVGLPIATLVHERMLDIVAAEAGLSRAEIRRRNLVSAEELPYVSVTNQRYDSGDYVAALDSALAMIDFDQFAKERVVARSEGRLLGVGLASYIEWTGNNSKMFAARGMKAMRGFDSCQIELDAEGQAFVWTSSPAIGQGTATTYAQVLADVTGIEFNRIHVSRSDTGAGKVAGMGTGASRSANVTTGAISLAGEEIRKRLIEDAAERLEANPVDLTVSGSVVEVVGSPRNAVSLADLVRDAKPGRYQVGREFDAPQVLYSYATHACKVEVDADTGGVKILDYVVAEDCGRVINPPIVEGQTQGAIAQGIGEALFEELPYDELGQPQAASFMDYLIPTACEVPPVRIHHLELPVPDSVIGSKGVGEGGTIPVGAVIANAVSDALGTEINKLPITPDTIQRIALEILRTP